MSLELFRMMLNGSGSRSLGHKSELRFLLSG